MKPIFTETDESFSTGAKRGSQAAKCRPDLTSPFAMERKGWVNSHGAANYGDRNWEQGMPFSRVVASICRHLMAYMQGDTTEDHLAQLGWNADALLHFEEMIKRGVLPANLNDMPKYQNQCPPTLSLGVDGLGGVMVSPPSTDAKPLPAVTRPPQGGLVGQDRINYDDLLSLGASGAVARQVVAGMSYSPAAWWRRFVYIAGPMRGLPEFNFPAFDDARQRLLELDYGVISPADIDRAIGDKNRLDQGIFCLRDFFALYFIATREHDGFIAMLPGWESSVGAVAEFMIARWLGLPVLDAKTLRLMDYKCINTAALLDSIRSYLAEVNA